MAKCSSNGDLKKLQTIGRGKEVAAVGNAAKVHCRESEEALNHLSLVTANRILSQRLLAAFGQTKTEGTQSSAQGSHNTTHNTFSQLPPIFGRTKTLCGLTAFRLKDALTAQSITDFTFSFLSPLFTFLYFIFSIVFCVRLFCVALLQMLQINWPGFRRFQTKFKRAAIETVESEQTETVN